MRLEAADRSRILLKIPRGTKATLFKVVIWKGTGEQQEVRSCWMADPDGRVQEGGPAHWPEPVTTKGDLNTSTTPDGAYVTDSLTAPEKNPWNRRVRFGGMDFFSDGKSAALCTHDGDIWIVTSI